MMSHIAQGSPLLGSALALLLICGNPSVDSRRVPGEEAAKRCQRVNENIQWVRDFDEARAASIELGKPLFWLQVVGELDDGL